MSKEKPIIEKSYLLDHSLGLDFWIRYNVTENVSSLVHIDGTVHKIKGDHIAHLLKLVNQENGTYNECLAYFKSLT